MTRPIACALALAVATVLATPASPALAAQKTVQSKKKPEAPMPAIAYSGPFAAPSPLPMHYPQFDKIKDSDFAPAFDAGMAIQLREMAAIADNPAPPTFENTIVAMEKSGQVLNRATSVFFNLVATDKNDAREKLETEYAPKFSAHADAIALNPKLFARIKTLYDARDSLGLDAVDRRLLEKRYQDFVRAGAALDETQKARIRAINTELATLNTRFDQNVLAEVNDSAVVVDDRAQLAGMSEEQIAAAAEAAKARNLPGKYVIALLNTTGQPAEAQLQDRALRQRIFNASVARGSRGNQWDNTGVVAQVLKLRAERARLLGYDTYANYVLADETAGNQDNVNAMLRQLAPKAVANARREGADLQAMIDAEQKAAGHPGFSLQPWDWAYYSEKVRKAKFSFDESQLKPYFEMRNVLENGVFYAANRLYGLTFKERTDLPKYRADTWTYEVFDRDGKPLAIFIWDPYARASKRGGAWMNTYIAQSKLLGEQPVVANHLNIPKPSEGKPTLLTWDEVTTAFHEFGHALHGFFQDVRYPYFSMNVPRDFVEYPSQVNEMWADWPEVLAHYAKHYQTGAPMPKELLDKVIAASKFNQGFATTEYLAAAMLDQRWHQLPLEQIPDASGVMAFEASALKADGFDYAPVPPRYRTPYFSHIMGGYAAGYYAYIWSEVLAANTSKWIRDHGGLTRENGDRVREKVLAPGGEIAPDRLFPNLAGYEAKIEPLLEQRGLDSN
ncbi:M3 family metallopeptidase [Thermomonas haemolytica]|uniref:Peptidyl-dipeptidase Dcp n=1 Tax=Thermomonas haemolytica TaxID=141949 RepID=A0A4R3N9B4_9GAMM|nr:M3 family metallopeptidase [Thermomonas haemolytica]TCT26020.1 peptidyl-dipeptidase Dcp [Thermomonas haemolytica]TNY28992.1 dipeptidyl carboxypeptidase II [Thermomonas haemolytica]